MSGNEPTWNDSDDIYGAPHQDSQESSGPLWEPDPLEPIEAPDALAMDADDEAIVDLDAPEAPTPSVEGKADASPGDAGADAESPDAAADEPVNRPAEGARQATPAEVFSEEFIGSEGASDFLGLDDEFDVGHEAVDVQGVGGLELAASPFPETTEGATATATEPEVEQPEPGFATETEEFEDELTEDEFGELTEEELAELEGLDEDEDEHGGKRMLLLAGAGFGMAFVAVVAALLVPRLFGTEPIPVDPTPVATTTNTNAGGAAPADPGASTGGAPGLAQASGAPGLGVAKPVDPRLLLPGFLTLARSAPRLPKLIHVEDAAGLDDPIEPTDVAATGTGEPTDPGGLDPSVAPGEPVAPLTIEELLAQAQAHEAFFEGQADHIDITWRGTEAPMQAIVAPTKIMMPMVGPVRVTMTTGEIFEGRMHAMGQNKVWLDLDLGRIGLNGGTVESIAHLPGLAETMGVDPDRLATGRRVRAKVAGGVIYGRVRSIRGNQVTLVTDTGGKITLEDPELETISERASVVLKP